MAPYPRDEQPGPRSNLGSRLYLKQAAEVTVVLGYKYGLRENGLGSCIGRTRRSGHNLMCHQCTPEPTGSTRKRKCQSQPTKRDDYHAKPEKMVGTLKEQLDSITPALREMQLRKQERVKQFQAVQGQIQKISAEVAGQSEYDDSSSNVIVNKNDLSLKKLEEYQIELQRLHNEKVKQSAICFVRGSINFTLN
ncbi:unnamed protein product [Ilex paraguariensis]|uniref:Uncharacterized protein n=1 Tax=Ilex paraguariensis TaxID=185542 RepID=A0ABC8UV53_9AQUA